MAILEYHDVGEDRDEREGVIAASRFESHVRYLRRHYEVVSLAQAVDLLERPGALSEDVVVITFDDGYSGNYELAWPVLRAHRAPATIFVTTGFLDGTELWFDRVRHCLRDLRTWPNRVPQPLRSDLAAIMGEWPFRGPTETALARMKPLPPVERDRLIQRMMEACPPSHAPARAMSWVQVREMHTAGVEIGCHTVSHPILTTLSPAEQTQEIVRSRDRIAQETGRTPRFFAYPNGGAEDFDATTVAILRDASFTAACSTLRGANRPGCDPFSVMRIGCGPDSLNLLAARLGGLFDEAIRAWLPRIR